MAERGRGGVEELHLEPVLLAHRRGVHEPEGVVERARPGDRRAAVLAGELAVLGLEGRVDEERLHGLFSVSRAFPASSR